MSVCRMSVINVCLGNDCVALIAISFLWWNLLSWMPLSGISVCWMAEMSLFNAQIWNVCLRSVSVCDQCQKVQKSWRHTNRSKPFSIRRFRTEASSTKDPRHSADRHFKFRALNTQRCLTPTTAKQSSNTQTSRIYILQTYIIHTDIQNRHPRNESITKTSGTQSSKTMTSDCKTTGNRT